MTFFTALESVKMLLKERKQPREKSLSTALLGCWRMVQKQIQAQHKLVSVSTCPPGSG